MLIVAARYVRLICHGTGVLKGCFVSPEQNTNHFPGMRELNRKDSLARNMRRIMRRFPKEYNIFPRTWCLPAE